MSAPIPRFLACPAAAAIVVLLAAAPARAQPPAAAPPLPGSLTLLSRPSGASFRLMGDQVIVGRTPMTLERGLTGHYRVQSQEPGYEPWKRTLTLGGAGADTVWMSLRPKGAAFAALRSIIVPGWGQYYGDHPRRSLTWLGIAGASGAGLALAAIEYQNRADRYEEANDRYQAAATVEDVKRTFEERSKAADEAEDAFQLRQIALGVTAGVWALSMVDAVVTFPARRPEGLTLRPGGGAAALRLEPRLSAGPAGWTAGVRLGF